MNSTSSDTNKQKNVKKRFIHIYLIVFLFAIFAVVVGLWIWHEDRNNAKIIARPLHNALIAKGAMLVCDYGDNGKGVDNKLPWYNAYYQLPQKREEAKKTVMQIARENGFLLKQATFDERGHIQAADEFIDDFLYNIVPLKHNFNDLEEGKITLDFNVMHKDIELNKILCTHGNKLVRDENTTPISLQVALPRLKRP